jgi:hypothetical protein
MRWAAIMEGRTDKRPLRASNVYVEDERVYSYGPHFELARPLRDKRGRVTAYLLNGERYSVTTSKHQSSVRNALRDSKAPAVIIPYGALDAAGVDRDSVRIVDVLPDRYTETLRQTFELPYGAAWVPEDVWEERDSTDEEIEEILRRRNAHWVNARRHLTRDDLYADDLRRRYKVGERKVLRTGRGIWHEEIHIARAESGLVMYSWLDKRHWLGESLIKARVQWLEIERCARCDGAGLLYGPLRRHDNGSCQTCWGSGRARKMHYRWATFLSGFDHQERVPLYFFCEMPRGKQPRTVEEAYEMLKPDPVKMAEQMGRTVTRQGDIFAIPTGYDRKTLRAMGARIEKRNMSTNPRIKAPIHLPYILRTNHTASEVAHLPNGVTLARGMLYHDPSGRRADHARRRLGDGAAWHIVIKNTVPTSKRR